MSRMEEWYFDQDPSELYERLLVPGKFLPWAEELVRIGNPQPGNKILDVACGTGTVTRLIPPYVGVSGRTTGLDFNADRLEIAASLPLTSGSAIEWKVGDACDLPFRDAEFDMVFCQQGLQFFADEDAALCELHRVLEPHGRLAMTVWADPSDFFMSLAGALSRHVSDAIGQQSLAPFVYAGLNALPARMSEIGFADINIQSLTVPRERTDPGSAIPKEIMGNPVGPEVLGKGPEIMAKIVRDVLADMSNYQRGDKLVVPQSANLVVARVR